MTLPPRLTDLSFPPDPEDADRIAARARRRRLSQAGGAAGLVAASLVAMAAFGGSGGVAGLHVVDPAVTPPAGSATPAPPGAATPSPSYAPGEPGSPTAPPASPQPGDPQPSRPGGTTAPSGTPPAWTPPETAHVVRETVSDDPAKACAEERTFVFNDRPHDSTTVCLRYSWPTTMTYGNGGTFLVELCALNRNLSGSFADRPQLVVDGDDAEWRLQPTAMTEQTLPAGTCWRWTITWNGMQTTWVPYAAPEPLPAGTYTVQVGEPGGNSPYVVTGVPHDGRQTTLDIV